MWCLSWYYIIKRMKTIFKYAANHLFGKKTRDSIKDVVVYVFILLFVYTAASKLMEFESFQKVLGRSPLIGKYNSIFAYVIPLTELLISLFLIIPSTRRKALISSVILMAVFTIYLIYMISQPGHIPCSCGGVVSELTWTQHIIFNSIFILLGIGALQLK